MEVKHNCSDCQHRRDALVPCEWLESQDHIILDCPHYEKEKTLCDNCIHKPVCSIYRATGGKKQCEHHKEERKGEWVPVPSSDMMTGKAYKCSKCNKMRYGSFAPNYCQNCGADMRGT